MPEYLAPGVYIEEVSYRSKSIEGVSTSTAGFVGPARFGPVSGEPELITSFADYERIYGGPEPLIFDGVETPNFLAQAVRVFFENGGRRLYISRIYDGAGGQAETTNQEDISLPAGSLPVSLVTLRARFPGRGGDLRVTFLPRLTDNLLVEDPVTGDVQVKRIQEHDTVIVANLGSLASEHLYDVVRSGDILALRTTDDQDQVIADLDPSHTEVRLLTVDVSIERPISRPKRPREQYRLPDVLEGFSFHPDHANALGDYFTESPATRLESLTVPFSLVTEAGTNTGSELARALLGDNVLAALTTEDASLAERQRVYLLQDGSDGSLPGGPAYQGDSLAAGKSGLAAFEDLEDISIVAAPGFSYEYNDNRGRANAIMGYLIAHAERMRYRIAVLDAPNRQILSEVLAFRSRVDSTHAALYYPWVTILDPVSEMEINLPPSGFIAGIYARNDVEKGVHKAPANEVVRMAIGLEFLINKAQQDVLNPAGVNCLRYFEGRGYRVWGARTISSDPEWKYVNLRRYFAFLEHSIEKGTQWVVFENNGDALWANVQRTVDDFLYNEWKSGHLLGEKPQEAYFVRCDRTTMTQNDLDNGRLICLIGVAPLRPAEFVIFRIGQWTADRRA